MERRSEPTITSSSPTRSGTVVDAKMTLALWLRAGRAERGMTIETVSKITKIQPRILERLEAGKLDGLPAAVFVRGFVRSIARCVGLDETEAMRRYTAASEQALAPTAAARALVESMSELAPLTSARAHRAAPRVLDHQPAALEPSLAAGSLPGFAAVPVAEPVAVVATSAPAGATAPVGLIEAIAADLVAEVVSLESAASAEAAEAAPRKKRNRRGGKGRKRAELAVGTPAVPAEVVTAEVLATEVLAADVHAAPLAVVAAEVVAAAVVVAEVVTAPLAIVASPAATDGEDAVGPSVATWSPKMPTVVAPTVPWRRPHSRSAALLPVMPSLVIDDADPDSAERELEDRVAATQPARRSFLPPILLDREDRSTRQGGLTLAVILLLIAATLTLSYLMRRPSSSGDGVTLHEPGPVPALVADPQV